jgi:hypothetical protein
MRLQIVQDALKKKNIKYEYTEIDGCGSLDFLFRGLKFHVWEYEDRVWGADSEVEDGNLDNYIHFLRRRLKSVRSTLNLKTVRGIGYLLEN